MTLLLSAALARSPEPAPTVTAADCKEVAERLTRIGRQPVGDAPDERHRRVDLQMSYPPEASARP